METKGVPDKVVRDPVECLLKVEECHMNGLALLAVFLLQKPGSMDRISCSSSFDKATLVGRDGDNLPDAGINNLFKNLHCVT